MPPVRRVLPKKWRRGGGSQKQKRPSSRTMPGCSAVDEVATGASVVVSTGIEATKAVASVARMEAGRGVGRVEGAVRSDRVRIAPSDGGQEDGTTARRASRSPLAEDREVVANADNHNHNHDDDNTTDSEYSIKGVVEEYILSGGQHPIFAARSPSQQPPMGGGLSSSCDDDDDELQISVSYPIVQTSSLLLSSSAESADRQRSSSRSDSGSTTSSEELLEIVASRGCDVDDVREIISPTPSAMSATMMTRIRPTVSKDYSDYDGYSMDGMSAAPYDLLRVNSGNSGGEDRSWTIQRNDSHGSADRHNNAFSPSFDSVWGDGDNNHGRGDCDAHVDIGKSGSFDCSYSDGNHVSHANANGNNYHHRRPNRAFAAGPSPPPPMPFGELSRLEALLAASEKTRELREIKLRESERRNAELWRDVEASIARGESIQEEAESRLVALARRKDRESEEALCRAREREEERTRGRTHALEEQNRRLEATVELLVEEHRNATERLVDAEAVRESPPLPPDVPTSRATSREEEGGSPSRGKKADRREAQRNDTRESTTMRAPASSSSGASVLTRALDEENTALMAAIESLAEDLRIATERLADAESEVEASAARNEELEAELLRLDPSSRIEAGGSSESRAVKPPASVNAAERRDALDERRATSGPEDDAAADRLAALGSRNESVTEEEKKAERRREALEDQNSRLDTTEDFRNATERLVDAEEARESLDSALRHADDEAQRRSRELERVTGHRAALDGRCRALERTVDLLVGDYRNATEKLVDAEEELAKATFAASDGHASRLEEDNEVLQKEVAKMSKDKMQVMRRVNNCAVVDKLNEKLKASTQEVAKLENSMEEAAKCHAAKVDELVAEMTELRKEAENSTSSVAELTYRCDKLSIDLESSMANSAELESAKVKSDELTRNLASYSEALNAEKASLEAKATKLAQSENELTLRRSESQTTLRRLSAEVVSAHQEISRLSTEKEMIVEESSSQIQQISDLLKGFENENRRKDEAYQELWTKYSDLLVEKESAMAACERLQNEREAPVDRSREREELSSKVEELQNENNRQREQIETIMATGGILRDMNAMLETEKEVAASSLTREREAVVAEKQAIVEEAESQLQDVKVRLTELEEENKRKSDEFQELWTKSDSLLLEKESALATAKQLQHEKEQQLEQQTELLSKVEELQNANKALVEDRENLQATLPAKVDELRTENNQQAQRIKSLIGAEGILRQMNELLMTEKEATRQKLGLEIKTLRLKNVSIADEMTMLKKAHSTEMDRMQSEEDDLTWKINALMQNMDVRLKEKDTAISLLNKKIQSQLNETMILKNEVYRRDAEKKSINLNARLPNLKVVIENQQAELERKDKMISGLRMEIETRYKFEISRMQSKVDRMETWLHESLSFSTPPASPEKRSSNPQGSPFEGCSNPQSSLTSPCTVKF